MSPQQDAIAVETPVSTDNHLPLDRPETPFSADEANSETTTVANGDLEQAASTPRVSRRVRIFAAVAAISVAAYAGFERIGTTANVDLMESYQRYAGGFLAIGFTDTQPGILVLSEIEKQSLSLDATGRKNWLTGHSTRIDIAVGERKWSKRLRGPLIVMISSDGKINAAPLPWSLEQFRQAGIAVDCSGDFGAPKSCGAPFSDFEEFIKRPSLPELPKVARDFLIAARPASGTP